MQEAARTISPSKYLPSTVYVAFPEIFLSTCEPFTITHLPEMQTHRETGLSTGNNQRFGMFSANLVAC